MITPPKAKKIPHKLQIHNDLRIDNYFWMNQRDSHDVLSYLNAENQYFTHMTANTEEFKNSLFLEMKNRIKEDDSSVPFKDNGYWYIKRFETGKEYPIFSRKKDSLSSPEEIIFDVNSMATGHKFYTLNEFEISPDNTKVAFTIDTRGRRMYSLYFKDLITNEIYPYHIKNVEDFCWANDNQTIFYSVENSKTLRSEKIMKHTLGSNPKDDTLIFFEKDPIFEVSISKTKSNQFIFIESESSTTSEYQFLSADTPNGSFTIFNPRTSGLEYSLEHYQDYFYIINNANNATNFKLDKTPISKTSIQNWQNIIPHREDTLLEDIEIFKDYLVLSERFNGLAKIRIIPWQNPSAEHYLNFENETYTAYTSINLDFDTKILRYAFNSLTCPSSVIDYNMETRQKEVKKEQQVLDPSFNKENYISKRLWATAHDGVKVPISIVYHKNTTLSPSTPMLLYGYGSYGITIDPSFSSTRLSLLNRGFAFAIAHIRGGEDLGRNWYKNGKMLNKKNTFTDFIDCAKFLISSNFTSSPHLYAMGGSAGGLLMGAVLNIAPSLFNGVIAQVPFVDVLTTMLDSEIPLTTGEYEEWGNPNDQEYYFYMKSYSPYDNVKKTAYPNLLVLTGYHDSQVQYWEPAKWVALLRENKTDNNLLLFHTNMSAGHSGASGRFESLKETATEYTFLLSLENITK